VRVCILDSGIEASHPSVGAIAGAVAAVRGGDGEITIEPDEEGDLSGHGTACAGIVRSLAPDCQLFSVRVLGAGYTGSGKILMAGLRYAIEQGFDVVNMSLSTTKRELAESLHELADLAYFKKTMLIASAHNLPVESYPWRFASVVSVGSHDRPEPLDFFYNPEPPVEFFARGVDIDVAWLQGSTLRCTGNSFATPHMTGICALVLGRHPELTPFQLKSVLYLTASNVIGSR
jgi:subtilisin family serine protease